jgi:hypothetical protein
MLSHAATGTGSHSRPDYQAFYWSGRPYRCHSPRRMHFPGPLSRRRDIAPRHRRSRPSDSPTRTVIRHA